jgi:hypothetical protein
MGKAKKQSIKMAKRRGQRKRKLALKLSKKS